MKLITFLWLAVLSVFTLAWQDGSPAAGTVPRGFDSNVSQQSVFVPLSGEATCSNSFPIEDHRRFLPLVAKTARLAEPDSPFNLQDPTPAKIAGELVPIGDQLGDVGQYYSQIAPSLVSVLEIANRSETTQTFTVTLYGDTGYMAHSLGHCRIGAGDVLTLGASDGRLMFRSSGGTSAPGQICATAVSGRDAGGRVLDPTLHGIYHATVTAGDVASLEIGVRTGAGGNQEQASFRLSDRYPAVPHGRIADVVHLPAIVATQAPGNWWDTEIVVQNTGETAADLTFSLCDDTGRCFRNNQARLEAHERRLFLATHLLNEDRDGFLDARFGWYSATLLATSAAESSTTPGIAVVTNFFRQSVDDGAVSPRAEHGSTCLYQAGHPEMQFTRALSFSRSVPFYLRVYNPTGQVLPLAVEVTVENGRAVDSFTQSIPPHGAWTFSDRSVAAQAPPAPASESRPPGTMGIRITAEEEVSIFAWQNGWIDTGETPVVEDDAVWYVPLFAAPIVPFRWDTDSNLDPDRAQHPGADFGLAETQAGQHAQRPLWARKMNWYTWRAQRRFCNEAVGDGEPYSTYIPMWWGLGKCNQTFPDDRSCLNTEERLRRIRNDLASSCAGRPLFLANEPELSWQSFMTYHELGRLIYVLRDWPGQLYSPVFSSPSYEQPWYPPERDPWCEQAMNAQLCPQTPGCEKCVQDGDISGERDPFDITFKGLESYFGAPGRWVAGEVWPFETYIDGMLLHLYAYADADFGELHWRVPYLQQYRDRADEAGWPILVTEYGFVIWPDGTGQWPAIDEASVAAQVDDLRRLLQENLGNSEAKHLGNPQKLFWFHTGCTSVPSQGVEHLLCQFSSPTTLTQPVGECWHDDAVLNDGEDRQCGRE